jgi:hypothetical protein
VGANVLVREIIAKRYVGLLLGLKKCSIVG